MDKISPSGDLDKVPLELMRVRKAAERVKIKTFRGGGSQKGINHIKSCEGPVVGGNPGKSPPMHQRLCGMP